MGNVGFELGHHHIIISREQLWHQINKLHSNVTLSGIEQDSFIDFFNSMRKSIDF